MSEIAAAVSAGPRAAERVCALLYRGAPQRALRYVSEGPFGAAEWRGDSLDALADHLRRRPAETRTALVQTGGRFPRAPECALQTIPVVAKGAIASGSESTDCATHIGSIIAFQLRNGRAPAEAGRVALQQLDGVFTFVALLPGANKLLAGVKNGDLFLSFGDCDSFAFTDQRAAPDKSNLIGLEADDVAILTPLSISIVDRDGMWIEKRPSQAGGPARPLPIGAA